jgi:hypothetical protein
MNIWPKVQQFLCSVFNNVIEKHYDVIKLNINWIIFNKIILLIYFVIYLIKI